MKLLSETVLLADVPYIYITENVVWRTATGTKQMMQCVSATEDFSECIVFYHINTVICSVHCNVQ